MVRLTQDFVGKASKHSITHALGFEMPALLDSQLSCADIDMESCEAEKSILRRRLSESASEVERWVRILQMLKTFLLSMCLFREIFKVVNSCHFHFSSAEKKMLCLML
jgi:hypothetical protein